MSTAKRQIIRERFPTLTVADIMSRHVHTAKTSDQLRHVKSLMRMLGIRHLPVVDQHDRLVGLFSDRDIAYAWSRGPDTQVEAFMSRNTECAFAETTARCGAAIMIRQKIDSLPVVDDNRRVIGIVTATDFLEVAHRALTIQQAMGDEAA